MFIFFCKRYVNNNHTFVYLRGQMKKICTYIVQCFKAFLPFLFFNSIENIEFSSFKGKRLFKILVPKISKHTKCNLSVP